MNTEDYDDSPARVARLRRLANRQGLALAKCRIREPRHPSWQMWWIADMYTRFVVAGSGPFGPCLSLDDVEEMLREDDAD